MMLESLGSFPEAQYFFIEIYTNGTGNEGILIKSYWGT